MPEGGRGPVAVNNTIVGNGTGVNISGYDAGSEVINNIVVGNAALDIQDFNSPDIPLIENNDFYSFIGNALTGVVTNLVGTGGNISTNPDFACLPSDNFELLTGSPCIDAGSNGAPYLPASDFAGNSRILAGALNGPAIVDMGAFEYNPAFPPVACLYLQLPSNIVTIAASGQDSAVVTYPPPTGIPTATITTAPPPGSVFQAGTNIITAALSGTARMS